MRSGQYNLTFSQRPDYLSVHLQAALIDLDIAIRYINELMGHLRSHSDRRVLFVRETPQLTHQQDYAMIASIIANMLPAGVSFAIVDYSPSYKIVKECLLQESKSKNRNLMAFDTYAAAETWLLAQQN